MFKVTFFICANFVIVCQHAIALFDTVFVISAQIVVNVVACFTHELLIILNGIVLCNKTSQVAGTVTGHSLVCFHSASGLAIHRCSELFE